MAKRKRVGLVFSYNENWIGGTYYFLNLVQALNLLEDTRKPIVVVITNNLKDFDYLKKETGYAYLKVYNNNKPLSLLKKLINKVFVKMGKNHVYSQSDYLNKLDVIYKYYADEFFKEYKNCVYWIPDFQEKFLPQFFKQEEIDLRQKFYEIIAQNKRFVSFSSYTSLKHFEAIFPNTTVKKFVIQFAVTHPKFEDLNYTEVLEKYKLSTNFYFSPNQFWEHKNHLIVLKALKILKDKGVEVLVAFSGKENDYRNKDYVQNLKNFIKANNLEDNVKFLGFIPREEQILLLKHAKAIIQPSYFEGWSTVVEDVKAVNNFVLLSDIEVHREQMQNNCDFFNPSEANELALLMEKYINNNPDIVSVNYTLNRKKFSNDFVKLIEDATS